jgi:hypothetical protein
MISQNILDDICTYIGDAQGFNKRELYNKIKAYIEERGYDVDTNYVYQHILGLHIKPLDLQTEAFVLSKFEELYAAIGDALNKVPYIYILYKVKEKYGLDIDIKNNFPPEKCEYFDSILPSAPTSDL